MPLPPCEDKKTLADQFNSFFIMKIEIMESLVPTDIHLVNLDYLESEIEITVTLHEFRPVTIDETNKLILSATPESCKLDPIPTKLLRTILMYLHQLFRKLSISQYQMVQYLQT